MNDVGPASDGSIARVAVQSGQIEDSLSRA